ncbi:CtsR family transcriptional regulator [Abyssicoccus albus]|uniref:CtsR family transcriptional regulator n=1 Tax=Abyssicoccus albus TaxID=1817405 RepID=UPI00097E302C|nr:CtsR family transcriptional regulator [Abyssicoccus albus]AQL56891.1 CtsR family transcriptional regulator [Abyssicoccus albus]
MHNMSDIIEEYIKELFRQADQDEVEIKRAQIAEKFDCVPSQLNYVIKTRFTNEHGYTIESKRGGGGYIRITRVETSDQDAFLARIRGLIGDGISFNHSVRILDGLEENELITNREKRLMASAIQREVIPVDMELRDMIRANMMHQFIDIIQFYD